MSKRSRLAARLRAILEQAWRRRILRGASPGARHARPAGRRFAHTPATWERAHDILNAAIEMGPDERASFIALACRGDAELRNEVEALLRAHHATGLIDRLSDELMAPLVAPLRRPPGSDSDSDPRPPALADGASVTPPPPPAPRLDVGPTPRPVGDAGPERPRPRPDARGSARYDVLDELGSGGMGVVYRARETRLDRFVALKFLPQRLNTDPNAKHRFLLEARAAAALEHPNICTIHEVGETEDGGLFIAMPLYVGETLEARLARGAVPWQEAVDIAVQVALGLAAAHEAGIIHRDIKPANLCLTPEGVVKILDFGIVRVEDAALTGAGAVLGTAAYMSPEQARGTKLDPRTDLWSLGVVLYEMLTGERLFSGDDRDAVLAAIRSIEPVPLGRLTGTAPRPVSRSIEQMLSRNAEERPPTARAISRQLEEAARAPLDDGRAATTTADLAPEGERRQATVIVSGILGYSMLLERVPPATLTARLDRLRRAVEDVLHRHGGTLNEFAGDHFVGLFGVPVTHEDDVHRAVRAALELHGLADLGGEAPGEEPLVLRSGIGTGTLVAQPLAAGDRVYRLAGAPAQVATRLASHASAGVVLLDVASARAVRAQFVLESCDAVLGDEGEPIEVSRVTGARESAAPARPGGLTAFTGRDRELDALLSCFERTRAGEGELVTAVGEAGAGKSRLLHEFRGRLPPGAARLVRGQCPSYCGTRPYLPFVEALLQILGLDDRARADLTEDRVLAALREIGPDVLEPLAPFFLHLLSVPSERLAVPRNLRGEQLRAAMREALTALITVAAGREPLVILLEDWHWVDEASGEVLKQLAEVIASCPILVVVTYRPDHGPDWTISQPRTLIHLRPLTADESASMAKAMLDVVELDDDVTQRLHDRSGGNPFFLEELCQDLREADMLRVDGGRAVLSGAPERLDLPTTIQGVIRTRLDRLPSRTRDVVRSASVLGRDFTLPLLERLVADHHVLETSLDTLKSKGVVQQTRVVPEPTYRFKHVLTHEVAYDTLVHHQRKALHAEAGAAIEALCGDAPGEHAASLAHHFSRAEDWSKTVRYGLAAAHRARALSEFAEALATLEAVSGWIARVPAGGRHRELEIDTLLEQEELCETLGERGRQQELIERVAAMVEPDAEPRRMAEICRRRGDLYTLLDRYDEADEVLHTALGFAREAQDAKAEADVLRSLGLLHWHQREAGNALGYIGEALRIDRERGDDDAVIGDLINKGQILRDCGEIDKALASCEAAVEMADRLGSPLKPHALHVMVKLYRALGDDETAYALLLRADDLVGADPQRYPVQHAFFLSTHAHVLLTQGRIDEAIRIYEEALAVARRKQYAEGLARTLMPLADVLTGIGRDAEALPYLEEAAELFTRLNPLEEARAVRKIAEIHERARRYDSALEAWTRCRDLAEARGDSAGRLDALEGLARCLRERGRPARQVEAVIHEALETARDTGDPARHGRLLNSLGSLAWRDGAYADALGHYEAALERFRNADDVVHAGLMLNSIGVTLERLGRAAEARARLEEAIDLNRRTGQRLLEGHGLAALAELDLAEGKPADARRRFEASLRIRRAIRDTRGEAWMHVGVARVHAAQREPGLAAASVTAARRLADELADEELRHVCDALERDRVPSPALGT